MPRKQLIEELKNLLRQRGELTIQQREYAMIEEQGINEMHPLAKPSEENHHSQLRTLQSYIG